MFKSPLPGEHRHAPNSRRQDLHQHLQGCQTQPRPLPLPCQHHRRGHRAPVDEVERHRFAVPRQGEFYVQVSAAAIVFLTGRVFARHAAASSRVLTAPERGRAALVAAAFVRIFPHRFCRRFRAWVVGAGRPRGRFALPCLYTAAPSGLGGPCLDGQWQNQHGADRAAPSRPHLKISLHPWSLCALSGFTFSASLREAIKPWPTTLLRPAPILNFCVLCALCGKNKNGAG